MLDVEIITIINVHRRVLISMAHYSVTYSKSMLILSVYLSSYEILNGYMYFNQSFAWA